jgi:D-glucosaminate-6-phosphate ammonia-lyase
MKYEDLGVVPIINASGTVTRLGGAPLHTAALAAYDSAAQQSVAIEELQIAVSQRLSQWLNCEAGLIASGAAAALTLGTAAILAGTDLARMEALPDTSRFPNELLIASDQRSGYDHAVRAAGAKLVAVGMNEVVSGAGVRRVEPWEYTAAITDQTAGILYVQTDSSRPLLADVIQVAKEHGLPVLVDAAGEIPPVENLKRLVDSGADLVAFSGGKAMRGPQATGLLLGTRTLVGSALLQMLDMDDHPTLWTAPAEFFVAGEVVGMPRHGIGRGFKVSKESIMAVMTALEKFLGPEQSKLMNLWHDMLQRVSAALNAAGVDAELITHEDHVPRLNVKVNAEQNAFEVCQCLRNSSSRVFVGHSRLDEGVLVINAMAMRENEIEPLIAALVSEIH